MSRRTSPIQALVLAAALASFVACSGGDKSTGPGDGGNNPPPAGNPASIVAQEWQAGQTAPAGTALAPKVLVKDADGRAVKGVNVSFAVVSGGGTLSQNSAETGNDGVAQVAWTLGSNLGDNVVKASVQGLSEDVTFSATTRLPRWTYMVYLAADNNLAAAGVGDIDDLEAAGVVPDVRVVVQAEFSQQWLQRSGCQSGNASCVNRPNWNTFRYVVTGQGSNVAGPNGPAEDIGDRNMTDPAQLEEFVQWAKSNYPAERYALVVWNHGGGFTGLIEDATSAGSHLMSVSDLPLALKNTTKVDILDFDMCLMAGYETLSALKGSADYAVFSEEVVPGTGNPFNRLVSKLGATPDMSTRAAAEMFVTEWHADYDANQDRASTTRSAYDMAGFDAFETSLDALANTLTSNIDALRPTISQISQGTQAYSYPQLKDLVDLLDSLSVYTADAGLQAQIAAVKAQATGTFRVATRARIGTGGDAANVSRSSGLHIVLPSGNGDDRFTESGPASFGAYLALNPGAAWTQFLTAYVGAGGAGGAPEQPTTATLDQGDATRLEVYLLWAEEALDKGVDLDMMIYEPNGNLYVPFLGTVTPNGHLTNDSADDATYYEGYLTNRFVEPGSYYIFASLYSDPQNYQPQFDLLYRMDQSSEFQSRWSPDYPNLSKNSPTLSEDPDPTLQEAYDGSYNDLKLAGEFSIGAAVASRSPSGSSAMQLSVARAGRAAALARTPTSVQLRVARDAIARWHRAGGKQRLGQRAKVAAPKFNLFRGTRLGSGR
jgi:hypothetical protein